MLTFSAIVAIGKVCFCMCVRGKERGCVAIIPTCVIHILAVNFLAYLSLFNVRGVATS